jgi:hypothetical protein
MESNDVTQAAVGFIISVAVLIFLIRLANDSWRR